MVRMSFVLILTSLLGGCEVDTTTLEKYIKYPKHLSWTILGKEVFIFDETTDEIHVLKEDLREIWVYIEQASKVLDVIKEVCSSLYDESRKSEVYEKVMSLHRKKLIVLLKEDNYLETRGTV